MLTAPYVNARISCRERGAVCVSHGWRRTAADRAVWRVRAVRTAVRSAVWFMHGWLVTAGSAGVHLENACGGQGAA